MVETTVAINKMFRYRWRTPRNSAYDSSGLLRDVRLLTWPRRNATGNSKRLLSPPESTVAAPEALGAFFFGPPQSVFIFPGKGLSKAIVL